MTVNLIDLDLTAQTSKSEDPDKWWRCEFASVILSLVALITSVLSLAAQFVVRDKLYCIFQKKFHTNRQKIDMYRTFIFLNKEGEAAAILEVRAMLFDVAYSKIDEPDACYASPVLRVLASPNYEKLPTAAFYAALSSLERCS